MYFFFICEYFFYLKKNFIAYNLFLFKKKKYNNNNRKKLKINQKLIMFNSTFHSDLTIKCKDGITLHANKFILSSCSSVFEQLILSCEENMNEKGMLNGTGENIKIKNLRFSQFNSRTISFVLEYLYVGHIESDSLDKFKLLNNKHNHINASGGGGGDDNGDDDKNYYSIMEVYFASKFFLLNEVEELVLNYLENLLKISKDNDLPVKILSKSIKQFKDLNPNFNCLYLLIKDDYFSLLYKSIIKIPLNFIDYEAFSYETLSFILTDYNKETTTIIIEEEFNTSEYEVFRYLVFWSLNKLKIDNNLFIRHFELLLPIL